MTATHQIRSVDRELLVAMRTGDAFRVEELTRSLGVTATAIRQRIERLLDDGMIERQKVVSGRGRPTFRYRITSVGHQAAGANPTELTNALWRSILEIDDPELRSSMLRSVATKMGQQYADALESMTDCEDPSLQDRMKNLSSLMSAQQIAASVSCCSNLPVLDINACPYPSLTADATDRAMCKLEEQMLSEALGSPVHLSSCRLDGDACCQFSATESTSS